MAAAAIAGLAALALPASASAVTSAPATSQAASVSSHSFDGTPTVGALFMPNAYPILHTCTASVVRSKSHNVILTAAHCMTGTGKGYVFAPGYHNGKTPYGIWHVTAAFGSPAWIHQRAGSTKHDWAFLRVASSTRNGKSVRLQDVVGGNHLGHTAKVGASVHVPGYPVGAGGKPITCEATVYHHGGYPAFDCGGYVGGTSGSPWLTGHGKHRTVTGVIGGLHQGGCTPATSYSSPLGSSAHTAHKRAAHHHTGDTFPAPPGDGC